MKRWQKIGIIVSAISGILAILGTASVGIYKGINYFETKAHASDMIDEVKEDVQQVSMFVQGYTLRQKLRDYQDELYALRDRYNATSDLDIPEGRERTRYRYLEEQIREIQKELDSLDN